MKRIYLIGFMGSGKTTVGRLLAQKLNLDFIDLDFFIEKRYFKSVSQIFEEKGESQFREIEKNCLREIADFENVIIATGGGTPCHFDNIQWMNDTGDTFYLNYNAQKLAHRLSLTQKKTRPLIANLSDKELLEYIEKTLPQREQYYQQATYILEGTDEDIAEKIVEIIG